MQQRDSVVNKGSFCAFGVAQNTLEYAFTVYINYHLLFYFKSKTEIISNVFKYVYVVDLASVVCYEFVTV